MAALDAAMTSVPKLLMADWMMMLATAKTALWMPAGRPILTMRLRATGSKPKSRGVTRTTESVLSRRIKSVAALTV